jgi:hypothetical protein
VLQWRDASSNMTRDGIVVLVPERYINVNDTDNRFKPQIQPPNRPCKLIGTERK